MSQPFGSVIVRNIKAAFGYDFDSLEPIETIFVLDTHMGIMPVSFATFEEGDYTTIVMGTLISEMRYQRYIATNYWLNAKQEITVWLPPGGEEFSIALFRKKRPN